MPARHVPDLKTKFQLVIRYGRLRSMEELAGHFGRSPKTLHGWSGSDARRPADTLPADAFGKFVSLLAEILPECTSVECERLLEGPSTALAAILSQQDAVSLAALLDARAVPGKIRLIRKTDLALVMVDDDEDQADEHLRLGERFRLVFPGLHTCPYALMLQHAPSTWGCHFPWFETDRGLHHVPGDLRGTGAYGFLYEPVQTGTHSFYALVTPEPFPPGLGAYVRDRQALDRPALDQLHAFCERLSNRPHRILRLRIHFEER